jgi:hypothetical protein
MVWVWLVPRCTPCQVSSNVRKAYLPPAPHLTRWFGFGWCRDAHLARYTKTKDNESIREIAKKLKLDVFDLLFLNRLLFVTSISFAHAARC